MNAAGHQKKKHLWSKKAISYLVVFICCLLVAGFIGYYAKITYYDVPVPDKRITYSGDSLTFTYCYTKSSGGRIYNDFDKTGFAIVKFNNKFYKQPMTHCNHALYYFNRYLEDKNSADSLRFVELAKILLENDTGIVLKGIPCVVWFYEFEAAVYAPHQVPWISAISQGRAMSVLCRAYQLTKKQEYLDAAILATGPFKVDYTDGGLVSRDNSGNVYYEEYPFSGKTDHVLNGFITSLFGLHEVYRMSGDTAVKKLFEQGVHTLKNKDVLQRYDLGFWTTYSQSTGKTMSFKYQALHVMQLWELEKITGDVYFKEIGDKWVKYNFKHRYRIRFFLHAVLHYVRHYKQVSIKVLLP